MLHVRFEEFLAIQAVLGLILMSIVEAHLNLFMNETETKRLLGIPGELYYVRSGIINDYALSFNLPIKSDVDVIYFDWQNLRRSPPDSPMYYSLALSSSHPSVLMSALPSIPKEGMVPTKPSVFGITLRCSGSLTAEVDVRIQLNISIFSASNVTVLDLRRKKTCLKDFVPVKDLVQNYSANTFPVADEVDVTFSSGHVFYIAIGCACGAIFLIAISIVGCFVCAKKSPNTNDQNSDISAVRPLTQDKPFVRSNTPNNNGSIVSGVTPVVQHIFSDLAELKPHEVTQILEEIKINRNLVSLAGVLLEGAFGRVYSGMVLTESGTSTIEQKVYVKTVTAEARRDQVEMMMRDGCLMKGINHDNISSVFATCIDPDHPPLLIYVNSNDSNLKKFLQQCKISDILSAQQLLYMAIQIARAMQHLHRKRILHKDLATRNCLINGQLNIRVTDSALSRDIFVHDYHCLGDNENRPVKWLALEALVDRKFSPASDVWSFGVTLWEMFTMAQQPYAEVDPFEMAAYLQEGFRIAQPLNCPNELFAIMACCWSHNPEKRPKFSSIVVFLQDFYAALSRYV